MTLSPIIYLHWTISVSIEFWPHGIFHIYHSPVSHCALTISCDSTSAVSTARSAHQHYLDLVIIDFLSLFPVQHPSSILMTQCISQKVCEFHDTDGSIAWVCPWIWSVNFDIIELLSLCIIRRVNFFSIEKDGIFVNTSTFVSLVNLHTVFCVVLDVDLFGESIIGITVDTREVANSRLLFLL